MPTPNDYSDFRFQPNENRAGGDFSPTADAEPAPAAVPANVYPNSAGYGFEPTNRQFSTRPEFATEEKSIPEILHESTRESVAAHARLNEAYGLCQPVATLGSHAWLRDELANPCQRNLGTSSLTRRPKFRLRRPKGRKSQE